jgi:hypothetical protein
VKESSYRGYQLRCMSNFPLLDVSQVFGYNQLGFYFVQRTSGRIQELLKLPFGWFAPAFGGFGW